MGPFHEELLTRAIWFRGRWSGRRR